MARVIGQKEVVLSWIFDTVVLEHGVVQVDASLFTVPIGQTIPGTAIRKTYAHTNRKTGGFLPSIQAFTISSWFLQAPAFFLSDDVPGLLDGHGVLMINDKPYPDHFTLSMFFGGAGWRESVRGPAAGPDFRAFAGDTRLDNAVQFKRPFLVTIDTLEPFSMNLAWTAPGFTPIEDVNLKAIMYGRLQRPVS